MPPVPRPLSERFLEKIRTDDVGTGCWIWTASRNLGGYGVLGRGRHEHRASRHAHRIAYELFVGPIPEGLDIDHLCRVRACVNPQHLEPVTRRINTLRGVTVASRNARKTHCAKGHPYDATNTYVWRRNGSRMCRTCMRDRQEAARRRAGTRLKGEPLTHCKHGHPMSAENTYLNPSGRRECRACRRAIDRRRRPRKHHAILATSSR